MNNRLLFFTRPEVRRYAMAAAFVLAGLVAGTLRFMRIGAESPYGLSSYMSPWTDEAAYTFAVKQKALFDDWGTSPYGFFQRVNRHIPVYTALNLAWLKTFGTGYVSARSLAVLMNLAAGALLVLLLLRRSGSGAAFLAALLFGTNYFIIAYGRLALTHTEVIAFFAASVYCWFRSERRPAFAAAAGLFFICAYFTNQLGIVLLAVYGITWLQMLYAMPKKDVLVRAGYFGAGAVLATLAAIGVLGHRLSFADAGGYVLETFFWRRGTGGSGGSAGFLTPGQAKQVFELMPVISMLIPVFILQYARRIRTAFRNPYDPDTFMLAWFVIHLLFLGVFSYRPPRYHYYIVLPMAGMAARALYGLLRTDVVTVGRGERMAAAAAAVVAALFLALRVFAFWDVFRGTGPALTAFIAVAVVLVAAVAEEFPGRMKVLRTAVVACIAAVTVWVSAARYAAWDGGPRYRTTDSGREMGLALPENAYIGMVGSQADAFGLESRIRECSYVSPDKKLEGSYRLLFEHEPVTHMLVRHDGKAHHRAWQGDCPGIFTSRELVGTYYFKVFAVDLYRVKNTFHDTAACPRSAFERAVRLMGERKNDEAAATFERHLAERPGHGGAWYRLGLLAAARDAGRAVECLERARALLPLSYAVRRNLGSLYALRGDREQALAEWSEALRLMPNDRELAKMNDALQRSAPVRPRLVLANEFL